MRIPHIFYPQGLKLYQSLPLDSAKSHHLLKVLRLKEGHPLTLFSGDGTTYVGKISRIDKEQVWIEASEQEAVDRESPLRLTLIQSLCKGDKMDWIVQKATELGVHQIMPIYTEHTDVRLAKDKIGKKVEHWRAVAVSAAEQAKRQAVPDIHTPVTLEAYLQAHPVTPSSPLFVLNPTNSATFAEVSPAPQQCALLIGPEGGLSDQELNRLNQHQAKCIQMGPRVLRTETAAITAIALSQAYWGDFIALT